MVIEEGKFYRARLGDKVEIVKVFGDRELYAVGVTCSSSGGSEVIGYKADGASRPASCFDLIEEWTDTEPEKPVWPEGVPAWANWVAMDRSGYWNWYTEKPQVSGSIWVSYTGLRGDLPQEFAPSFDGEHTDSLIERPKPSESKDAPMKPEWPEDAPEWANFLAMDENKEWWFFPFRPEIFDSHYWSGSDDDDGNTRCYLESVKEFKGDWRNSLIERPKPSEPKDHSAPEEPSLWPSSAPVWADYLAMDANGQWYFFSNKPVLGKKVWSIFDGSSEAVGNPFVGDWEKALIKRPGVE